MKPSEALAAHRDKLLAIAAGHGASNLRVFGSVARGADKEGSDIDLLVDVRQGTSLFDLVGLQQDFEDTLGMKVDLLTEPELHPLIRERLTGRSARIMNDRDKLYVVHIAEAIERIHRFTATGAPHSWRTT